MIKRALESRVSGPTPVTLGLTLAFWAHSALSASGNPSADVAAAQALFERGRALMAQRRVAQACPLFEESQRLDAGIGTQYNLANCYEAMGRFASAYTTATTVGVLNPATNNVLTPGSNEADSPVKSLVRGAPVTLGSLTMLPVQTLDPSTLKS